MFRMQCRNRLELLFEILWHFFIFIRNFLLNLILFYFVVYDEKTKRRRQTAENDGKLWRNDDDGKTMTEKWWDRRQTATKRRRQTVDGTTTHPPTNLLIRLDRHAYNAPDRGLRFGGFWTTVVCNCGMLGMYDSWSDIIIFWVIWSRVFWNTMIY